LIKDLTACIHGITATNAGSRSGGTARIKREDLRLVCFDVVG
jgi:hypothetical protein